MNRCYLLVRIVVAVSFWTLSLAFILTHLLYTFSTPDPPSEGNLAYRKDGNRDHKGHKGRQKYHFYTQLGKVEGNKLNITGCGS